jgi:hypothetical protein
MVARLTSDERIYRLAVANVERTWGAALSQLGRSLRRALILAEVLTMIGGQDNEANPMVRLATHAITRVNE